VGLEGAATFGQEVTPLLHLWQQSNCQAAGLSGEHAEEDGGQRTPHQDDPELRHDLGEFAGKYFCVFSLKDRQK
jgi:hypothetical protein